MIGLMPTGHIQGLLFVRGLEVNQRLMRTNFTCLGFVMLEAPPAVELWVNVGQE